MATFDAPLCELRHHEDKEGVIETLQLWVAGALNDALVPSPLTLCRIRTLLLATLCLHYQHEDYMASRYFQASMGLFRQYNEGPYELKTMLPADQYLEVTFVSLASITELLNLQRLAELCAHGLYGEKSGSELARITIEFLKLCEPDDSAFLRAKLENQWFLLGNYYD
ncbi:hypothetical protein CEP54_000291 [Fusarium duplospermum]|uniref:Uncharacterized protein n=1 Tax=Fusarium duplospermum TaxID=1325734 RepID=A0A428R8N4_9HYPO|nr:hypothetical protein CEP54_000291 [Fusarium duplospermum]